MAALGLLRAAASSGAPPHFLPSSEPLPQPETSPHCTPGRPEPEWSVGNRAAGPKYTWCTETFFNLDANDAHGVERSSERAQSLATQQAGGEVWPLHASEMAVVPSGHALSPVLSSHASAVTPEPGM